MLPNNYFVTGGVEGTRYLFEDVPVHAQVSDGNGPLEHKRRSVGIFSKKTKRSLIEEAALLDYRSRHAVSEDQRLQCLRDLAELFKGFGG